MFIFFTIAFLCKIFKLNPDQTPFVTDQKMVWSIRKLPFNSLATAKPVLSYGQLQALSGTKLHTITM